MKVSLAFNRNVKSPDGLAITAEPLLNEVGPHVILGGQNASKLLAEPISPRPDTLFGPRGAILARRDGPLIACDTGHHRLMIWSKVPTSDNEACDLIIGHPDALSEGRNGKGEVTASTLNVPTGIASDGVMLAVADAWNHRVLIWKQIPTTSNQPADVVIGQEDFSGGLANRGGSAGADTLHWCYGVALIDGNLVVADTGNRRVLIWRGIPDENGAPADLVLGQSDFSTRDENAGVDGGPLGMRWPHSVVAINDSILVSDAGNNRIMVWKTLPTKPGVPCDYVLGQKDICSLEHNRASYLPNEQALNMPYGMTAVGDLLIVADTANSRLVGWKIADLCADAPAVKLSAQPNFSSKGDNRWQMPVRDSLCWPYSITATDKTLIISDSGNNRIMLWDLAV